MVNTVILLADDDADDVAIFHEALDRVAPRVEFHTAENGFKLFDMLLRHKPDVIFLDINMPKMDGWECLTKLKNDAVYGSIPVIVYSTSSAKKDIKKAYSLGAFLFITKPEDFAELLKILQVVATGLEDDPIKRLKGFASVRLN